MWKKTGAWFYKGIPKYEVPQRNVSVRAPQREPTANVEKPVKLRIKCVDTSSEEDEADAVARGDGLFTRDRPSSCKFKEDSVVFSISCTNIICVWIKLYLSIHCSIGKSLPNPKWSRFHQRTDIPLWNGRRCRSEALTTTVALFHVVDRCPVPSRCQRLRRQIAA